MQPQVAAWQVWHAYLTYEQDPSQGKRRPVVVYEVQADMCTVALYVTSKRRQWEQHPRKYVPIRDWEQTGLACESFIRVSRPFTIPIRELEGYAGMLSDYDQLSVQLAFSRMGL